MGDPPLPPEPSPSQLVTIPKPKIGEIEPLQIVNAVSYFEAIKEQIGFLSGKQSELAWDWRQKHIFKWALFIFVLGISAWWSISVLRMVWKSGTAGSTFHLSDSVLITLVSTSIANFLGLVVIVARHLFPSTKQ
jgi:hypothetical protein